MGLFSGLKALKERVTGEAARKVRTETFAESAQLFDYILDVYGWERAGTSPASRRQGASARDATTFNLRKFDEDAYIKRGVNLHTDFTFGRGIDVPKSKSEVIQEEVINKLWWSAANQRNFFSFVAQQRRHKETLISGELNVLVKINEKDSTLKLYPINPRDIVEVIPDEEDQTRPAFYLLRSKKRKWDFARNEWESTSFEEKVLHRAMRYKLMEAPDEELQRGLVYHVGLNEFFELMRGQSDIQTIFDAADSARDMADDGTALSRANAETAYKTEILKGGKTVKDAFLAYVRTKTDGSNPNPAPASDWVQNKALNREWMQSRDTGAQHRKEDIRSQRSYVWAGAGFGEHYMGDASTGNLATATAMELPVLKMIQAEQKLWASIYGDLVDFAIDVAIATGKIPGAVVDPDELEVDTDENRSYSINFPPILQKEVASTLTALGIGKDKNMIPEQTAARLAMELFEVEDIDEALDELFSDKEVEAEIEKLRAQIAAQQQPALPGQEVPAQAAGEAAPNQGGQEPHGVPAGVVPPGSAEMRPGQAPAGTNGGGNGNGGPK